jgi:hypothetical protein
MKVNCIVGTCCCCSQSELPVVTLASLFGDSFSLIFNNYITWPIESQGLLSDYWRNIHLLGDKVVSHSAARKPLLVFCARISATISNYDAGWKPILYTGRKLIPSGYRTIASSLNGLKTTDINYVTEGLKRIL